MVDTAVRKRPRARYIVAAVVCGLVVVWMLTLLQRNVVYLEPVSEAVAERDEQGERRFRMGGSVVPVAEVVHEGSPPDLFQDCAPVVVEGRWEGATFTSDRLLIKHGNEYEPPQGAAAEDCPDEPAGVR